MKTLWFTNTPVVNETNTGTGGWLHAYACSLIKSGVEIRAVCRKPVNIPDGLLLPHTWLARSCFDNKAVTDIIKEYQPDIIHIHGTEANFGLINSLWETSIPIVHSIQGFVSVIANYWVNSVGWRNALRCVTLQHMLFGLDLFGMERSFIERGINEQSVISHYRHFVGRTDWDRAHVMSMNPNAKYYHLEEPMRLPFYQEPERYTVPGRIYVTSGDISYKGGHIAVKALNILRQFVPEAHLHISGVAPKEGLRGSGYLKWLQRDINKLGLCDCVNWLGAIDPDQMVRELNEAQVHLTPSFIENSPNSTQEAMMQATPCVISYTGGTPSLASEGKTALFFPSGDAAVCAYKMLWLMEHHEEAEAMGQRARQLGLVRNNSESITKRLIEVYNEVVACGT